MSNEVKISPERLKHLERVESKMNALESGGVDNWEFYDEALTAYRKQNEIGERIETLTDELARIFGEYRLGRLLNVELE